jgi:Family of unknown function (DUF5335)
MTMQRLQKSEWNGFCELMTKELAGMCAEIEVASLDLGLQLEARWLPLVALSYDPNNDILEFSLDGHDHIVPHPREVYVEFGASGVESIGVLDASRAWQIVLLRTPLMLPSPHWH